MHEQLHLSSVKMPILSDLMTRKIFKALNIQISCQKRKFGKKSPRTLRNLRMSDINQILTV